MIAARTAQQRAVVDRLSFFIGAFLLESEIGSGVGYPSAEQQTVVDDDASVGWNLHGGELHRPPQNTVCPPPTEETKAECLPPVQVVVDDCGKLVRSKWRKKHPDEPRGGSKVSLASSDHGDWSVFRVNERKIAQQTNVLSVWEVHRVQKYGKVVVVPLLVHRNESISSIENFNA